MVIHTDDEQASEGSSEHLVVLVGHQDAVRSGDGLGSVRHQGNVELADTAVLSLGASPGEVGVVGVGGDSQHLGVDGGELGALLTEGDDLGLQSS